MHLKRSEQILLNLGRGLKFIRKKKNISIESLAQRVKISHVTIWSIEKGSPSVAIGSYLKVVNELKAEEEVYKLLRFDETS